MEDLIKFILIILFVFGGSILKMLQKSGDNEQDEASLEARLEEAIRQAKDHTRGGRKPATTTPPPVAPIPPRHQSPAPSSAPRAARPKPPAPVQQSPQIRPRPVAAAQPPPMPAPPPSPTPASSFEDLADIQPRSVTLARKPVETEAVRHQEKFERLMTMDAYRLPDKKVKLSRAAKSQERAKSPQTRRSALRAMIVHAEILSPPLSRRRGAPAAGALLIPPRG